MGERHWLLDRQDPRTVAMVCAVITIAAAVFAARSGHQGDGFIAVFAGAVAVLGGIQVAFHVRKFRRRD